MNADAATPDPSPIFDAIEGGYRAQVIRLALLLDVFTPLADGPRDATAVAAACSADPVGVRGLLDYLVGINLLGWQDGAYCLSPTAATFLVRTAPSYAGGYLLSETDPTMWTGILGALRSRRPIDYWAPYDQDAWLESYSRTRPEQSRAMWRAAGIEPGTRPGLRVLDLACGCAVKSLVLAEADPTVRVTCLDRAPVLAVARDLARRMGVLSQVTFIAEDLMSAQLGEERFDAALLGQITYFLTPAQNADLLRRVGAALTPGGTLVIDAVMPAPGQPSAWAGLIALLTRALTGGNAHTFADYQGWLEDAGFAPVRQLSEHWLAAWKA